MRWFGWITLAFLIVLTMFVVGVREGEVQTIETLQGNLSNLNNVTVALTKEAFPYKNPYQTNFTIKDFVTNTIHVITYPIIQEINTVIGTGTNLIWEKITKETVIKGKRIILTIIIIWLTLKAIKPLAIIYLLIKEYKERRQWKKQENKQSKINS